MPDPAKRARANSSDDQRKTVGDQMAATWREENSVALEAHVAFIEEHGTLTERLMTSPKPGENVREEQARQWLQENEQAFREYNDAIKKFGVWFDGWRSC